MSNRNTNIVATCLLFFVFWLAVFSILDDSATMDEIAHLPAGYSYLTQKDMRLNPEHPPLIKDLSALPLLFIKNINFPSEIKEWKEDINGQWGFGFNFLYRSGNPADEMLFLARIPMILVLILLGFFIFRWAKQAFGNRAAILALFLFSFSPTLLAHGRLVTTDIAATLGVVLSTYFWLKFLRNPTKQNVIFAGLIFGVTMLFKFSLILLLPFLAILTLIYALLNSRTKYITKIIKYFVLALLVGIIGMVFIVWPVYKYHLLNYPVERQIRDTQFILSDVGVSKTLTKVNLFLASKPILRPFGQYLLGLLMAIRRTASGNTTYFLGEISNRGWFNYFLVVYFIKETLAFHIILLIAVLYAAYRIKKPFWQKTFQRTKEWLKDHYTEFAMLLFVGIYWVVSLSSNLNIGVRHLLPVFPFTILLASSIISSWLRPPFLLARKFFLVIILLWQAYSVLAIYPHFLAYFNELVGGPDKGYLYVVDSNLDWGQDLKRLKKWTDENNIDKLYVNYFGGGDAQYYLKEKYAPWGGTRDPQELPEGSYLAVSATLLQGGRGQPVQGFNQTTGYYRWLDGHNPIAKIGYSIFVYRVP